MDQGYCTFPELEVNIGAEMEFSRGIKPSSCRLWFVAKPEINRKIGTLSFRYGSTQIDFPQSALAPSTLRQLLARQGYIWTIQIYDRRWKWRYKRISGEYNVRTCDGKIEGETKKSLKELIALLFGALGESSWNLVNVPDEVYPHVKWNRSYAANQLAHVCEMYGCIPLIGLDNIARVERLGAGADLPDDTYITPKSLFSHAIVPAQVKVIGGPTMVQDELELEAVGLDVDGSIKIVDDLSYKPPGGWSTQWYTTFYDVDIRYRHLAFQTVWRWYRVKVPFTVSAINETVNSLNQVWLSEKAAESFGKCLDPVVRGLFWDRGDFQLNTDWMFANTRDDAFYNAGFKILTDKNIVEFEYPVIKFSQGLPVSADLWLTAGFRVRDILTSDWVSESYIASVSNSESSEIRTDRHSHVVRGIITKSVRPGGMAYDTQSLAQTELGTAARWIALTYNGAPAEDRWYPILRRIDLDGAVAQVRWRVGRDAGASTRASRHSEFSIYTPDYQARRRSERLAQIADDLYQ